MKEPPPNLGWVKLSGTMAMLHFPFDRRALVSKFADDFAAQGVDMTTVLMEFIQDCVAKHRTAAKKGTARVKHAGSRPGLMRICP
jgi:hypothetical protein